MTTRQILESYNDIRQALPSAENDFVRDYAAMKDDINTIEKRVPELFVLAGYGGIAVSSLTNLGTIDSTFQNITGYDVDLIATPRLVTYDKANDGIIVDAEGVWEFSLRATISFDSTNAGREIKLRTFNATTSTAGLEFTFFAGRNQDGINLIETIALEISSSGVGDLIQLQIGSTTDTFTNSDIINATYQVKHISELKGEL